MVDEEDRDGRAVGTGPMLAAGAAALTISERGQNRLRRAHDLAATARATHARERHAVQALAARDEHELVLFVREAVNIDGVEIVRIEPPLTIDWELRGLPAAARRHRLDAFVTPQRTAAVGRRPPVVVWLFESPVHRIRSNRRSGPRCGTAVATRSRACCGGGRSGARRTSPSDRRRRETRSLAEIPLASTSVVYPGVPPGFSAEAPSARASCFISARWIRATTRRWRSRHVGVPESRCVVVGGWRATERTHSGACRTTTSSRSIAARRRSSTRRCTKASATACSRRWRAAPPSSRRTRRPFLRSSGDAAILCDPNDVDALAAAVRRVLDEPGCADEMRERGLRRASAFNWDRTGEGLSAAIAAVLP